jgi:FkbM family methyltransferase
MMHPVNRFLAKLGYRVVQDSPLLFHGQALNDLYSQAPWIKYWIELTDDQRAIIGPLLCFSKAQLGQDLFAFIESRKNSEPRTPYFVDIGASDGVRFSNTWLLEKHLDWHGIAAEPARCWHPSLNTSRSCIIDTHAVFNVTGEDLLFLDVSNLKGYRELSGLASTSGSDERQLERQADPTTYNVHTISLNDLLSFHQAPSFIDFLSIDTEGSELPILQAFNFDSYRFGSICVEHNYNPEARDSIHDLLSRNGYQRKHASASAWDDWYVPCIP